MPNNKELEKEYIEFCKMNPHLFPSFETVTESGDWWLSKLSSHTAELLQRLEEEVGEVEKSREYKAMVENGDLSFLNYTPTGIYTKALKDVRSLIKKFKEEMK